MGALTGAGSLALQGVTATWALEPYRGERSGDRLLLEETSAGLLFTVADMGGHGEFAAACWDRIDDVFAAAWDELKARPSQDGFRDLAREVNLAAHGAGASLCLTVGLLSPAGVLDWATFGFGVHLLPVGPAGLWQAPAEQTFGLKLGWLGAERDGLPRAFVPNRLADVSRIVAISDAFLGDDHRDPQGALATVERIGRLAERLDGPALRERVLEIPHAEDDATVFVLEAMGETPPAGAPKED